MTVNVQTWKKKIAAMETEVSRLEDRVRKEKARITAQGGHVAGHCD